MNTVGKKKEIRSRNLSHVYFLHLIYIIELDLICKIKLKKLSWIFTLAVKLPQPLAEREREVEKDDEKFTVSKNNILRTETNR
jgi:hypothetical protein